MGANMLNGIVNALALQINPFKKAEYSVIETDEAFLVKIYNIHPYLYSLCIFIAYTVFTYLPMIGLKKLIWDRKGDKSNV